MYIHKQHLLCQVASPLNVAMCILNQCMDALLYLNGFDALAVTHVYV